MAEIGDVTSNPIMSYIFGGNTGVPSQQALEQRRKIALAMAMQKKPFPKTLGEGISYLGDSFNEIMQQRRLDAAEQARDQRLNTMRSTAAGQNAGTPTAAVTGAPAPDAPPAFASPAQRADLGSVDPALLAMRRDAIGGKEADSRGYQTVGVDTRGDRPYGRYGIMGKNIPEWTQAALGQPMTPQQFLANSQAQDAVFDHRFGGYANKYGEEGAARAWFGGERGMKNPAARDVLGTSVSGYGQDYLSRLRRAQPPQAQQQPAAAPAPVAGPSAEAGEATDATTTADAAPASDQRDALATALLQGNGAGVPQENPTLSGPQAPTSQAADLGGPPPDGGGVQLASLGGAGGTLSDAPPVGAEPPPNVVAQASPGAGNPPIVSDIQPAPTAGPPRKYPGPYDQPAPLPPSPTFGDKTPASYSQLPEEPPPPKPTPFYPQEVYAQQMMMQNPGDKEVAEMMQLHAAPYAAARQAADARNVDIYKANLARYEAAAKAADAAKTPAERLKQQQGEEQAAREDQEIKQFGMKGGREFYRDKVLMPSYEATKTIPAAVLATNSARQLLNNNPKMFTGADAEIKMDLQRLSSILTGKPVDPSVDKTQMFKAVMGPLMQSMRCAIVGAGSQSEKEFDNLKQTVGSDPKLEPGAIKGILDQVERVNRAIALDHQDKLQTFTANDPNLQRIFRSVGMSPETMSQLVPPAAVERLSANDSPEVRKMFDTTFRTPGLADHIMRRR